MPDTMNLNVRISGSLKDYVSEEIRTGAYENLSEYVRDLIRRDKDRQEEAAFAKLKAELQKAFSAPESEFEAVTADHIRDRANLRLRQ